MAAVQQTIVDIGARMLGRLKQSSKLAKILAFTATLAVPVGLLADGVSLMRELLSDDAPAAAAPAASMAGNEEEGLTDLSRHVSVNYMRTFGGYRTSLLMTAIAEGGFSQIDEQGGRLRRSGQVIEGELPGFYQTWQYRDIQPLGNAIWQRISSISAAFDAVGEGLRTDDPALRETCLNRLMGVDVWEDEGPQASLPFTCDVSEQDNVGYLFLILEGGDGMTSGPVRITYADVGPASAALDWANYDTARAEAICAAVDPARNEQQIDGITVRTRTLAGIAAGRRYLWPVAMYQTLPDDRFRGRLVGNAEIALCLSTEGARPMTIRAPGREDAITVPIPDGWYWQ